MPSPIGSFKVQGKIGQIYNLTPDLQTENGKPNEAARQLVKERLKLGETTPHFRTPEGTRVRVEGKSRNRLNGTISWKDIDVKNQERKVTTGNRGEAIKTLTPPDKIAEGQAAMAEANRAGKHGHHGLPLAKALAGFKDIEARKGRPAAVKWLDTQRQVKQPLGHDPENIVGVYDELHSYIHNDQEIDLEESIKNAGFEWDLIQRRVREGLPITTAEALPQTPPQEKPELPPTTTQQKPTVLPKTPPASKTRVPSQTSVTPKQDLGIPVMSSQQDLTFNLDVSQQPAGITPQQAMMGLGSAALGIVNFVFNPANYMR